jgi:hypothetical protein
MGIRGVDGFFGAIFMVLTLVALTLVVFQELFSSFLEIIHDDFSGCGIFDSVLFSDICYALSMVNYVGN